MASRACLAAPAHRDSRAVRSALNANSSNNCRTTPNAKSCSNSVPRAAVTSSPARVASARISARSRLFPVPAAPFTRSRPPPLSIPAIVLAIRADSASRSSRSSSLCAIAPVFPRMSCPSSLPAWCRRHAWQRAGTALTRPAPALRRPVERTRRPPRVYCASTCGSSPCPCPKWRIMLGRAKAPSATFRARRPRHTHGPGRAGTCHCPEMRHEPVEARPRAHGSRRRTSDARM